MRWLRALDSRLFQPVDIASLALFRVAFGGIMLVEVWRYFDHGWIERFYIRPEFYFKYYGFEWVQPWAGDGMYWHFAILGLLAACILAGFLYRLATVLFTLAFIYVFLLDQTRHLNHFYLVILISFLMCVLPANRAYSLDAWLRPRLRARTVPAWAVWTLVIQFEVVYLYAGIAKLNGDWLRLEPLRMWLGDRTDFPVIGPLFAEDWVVAIGAYGVILLHLVGAPLLLWRRTRAGIFVLYVVFHLMNHFLFRIGIFPWLTLAGTLMFFEPDWPRRLLRRPVGLGANWLAPLIGRVTQLRDTRRMLRSNTPQLARAGGLNRLDSGTTFAARYSWLLPASIGRRPLVLGFLSAWFAVQILVPLRHWLYPGDVNWTEEGHRFAWHMKLRDKDARATFAVNDPATGRTWQVRPRQYLSRKQASKMPARPDMVLQFAHHLANIWSKEKGIPKVEVRATVWCSLNGRAYDLLVDKKRDLAEVERSLRPADWILPLEAPLREWNLDAPVLVNR